MKFPTKKNQSEQADKSTPKKDKSVTQNEATHSFINAAKEFEKSRIDDIERSRVVAWRVAIGACALAIVSVLAVVLLTPLKEVKPYVSVLITIQGQPILSRC